jgi:pilus assembly protein CpaE
LQFGDVTVFINEQGKNSVADLAPRTEELDMDVVNDVLLTHGPSGVKVLAAPSRPEYAEEVTGDQFAKILQYLCRMFAYVVVDTSSVLTDVTLAAMDVSNIILLITTQDIPAIKNARQFLDLSTILKLPRRRILFVMNRFDRRIGITPEKVGESFKHEISAVIPLDDRTVVPSVNRGVPLMLGDRTRTVARSFLQVAEVVRQRIAELAEQELAPRESGSKIVTSRLGKR